MSDHEEDFFRPAFDDDDIEDAADDNHIEDVAKDIPAFRNNSADEVFGEVNDLEERDNGSNILNVVNLSDCSLLEVRRNF